jgi:hypothetical protein
LTDGFLLGLFWNWVDDSRSAGFLEAAGGQWTICRVNCLRCGAAKGLVLDVEDLGISQGPALTNAVCKAAEVLRQPALANSLASSFRCSSTNDGFCRTFLIGSNTLPARVVVQRHRKMVRAGWAKKSRRTCPAA